ncbi:MAG TPA: NADP-dependent succinic semialdehyde dehydrogenase [Acidimicrobiales bacterium]|nr:NADP-dependent succinic semialdehyde dehydrogenase [Acidimicrobiales bacterium]
MSRSVCAFAFTGSRGVPGVLDIALATELAACAGVGVDALLDALVARANTATEDDVCLSPCSGSPAAPPDRNRRQREEQSRLEPDAWKRGAMAIATINPATGETEKTFEPLAEAEIDARLARAREAFDTYRLTSFDQRAGWLRRAADILDADADGTARTMTTEMGKTIAAARAEVHKCAVACRFYAEHAAEFLADEPADPGAVGAVRAYAMYQPLGVVLAVMPWNFPLWQAMRFAAPALMAGNVGLLKHASNVPQTALFMEELFARAGFPEAVFQTLLIGSDAVERVLRDDRVAAATLTGSSPAGRSVAAIAGDAIKPTVLELGGSDPFIVMPSADLDRAASTAATARCQNNGQSCIAAKRFLIHEAVAGEFEERFVAAMTALRVGDPMDDSTDVGPLATEQGRADVEDLVADAVAKGARVLCGGEALPGPGWYYPPTVVAGVTRDMRMFSEEVFGPVAAVYRVSGIDEAIDLANATEFGLGSNVWTSAADEQDRFVRDVAAGAVFVNGMTTSYPELPFGGIKGSGYGRELSAHGIREFCNLKTVWVGDGGAAGSAGRTARAE